MKKLILESFRNFDSIKYNDWSEFKNKLQNNIKNANGIEDLIQKMDLKYDVYQKISRNIIYHWKDSVSKSILNAISFLQYKIPQPGTKIFPNLAAQTRFLIIAGPGNEQARGLRMLSPFELQRIKNTDPKLKEYNFDLHKDVMKKWVTIGGFYAQTIDPKDEQALRKVNKILQYVWLYVFWQHYSLKKKILNKEIKLPTYLYRGIRAKNIFNRENLKDVVSEIWKKDLTHDLKRKEVIDVLINYIIKNGLNKVSDGKFLSFSASMPISSYFANGEGFIVRVRSKDVRIITSELTEDGLAEKDFVSNKKEKEYIINIPNNYKFSKDDIFIEDLEYFVASQNPLAVNYFSHDDLIAKYDLNGKSIEARYYWSSNTKGSVVFYCDNDYGNGRNNFRKKYGFDPMPSEKNLSQISNFTITKKK
jgi:hypothetical protein